MTVLNFAMRKNILEFPNSCFKFIELNSKLKICDQSSDSNQDLDQDLDKLKRCMILVCTIHIWSESTQAKLSFS